jgi:hypothetical protein
MVHERNPFVVYERNEKNLYEKTFESKINSFFSSKKKKMLIERFDPKQITKDNVIYIFGPRDILFTNRESYFFESFSLFEDFEKVYKEYTENERFLVLDNTRFGQSCVYYIDANDEVFDSVEKIENLKPMIQVPNILSLKMQFFFQYHFFVHLPVT